MNMSDFFLWLKFKTIHSYQHKLHKKVIIKVVKSYVFLKYNYICIINYEKVCLTSPVILGLKYISAKIDKKNFDLLVAFDNFNSSSV